MPKQPRHRPVRKFENAKRVIIECDLDECPHCSEALQARNTWHMKKTVQTMAGPLYVAGKSKECANEKCSHSGTHYYASQALLISLPKSTYGLDVLAFIGWQHEHEHKQLVEIQRELNRRGVLVNERNVGKLYRQFLALLGAMSEQTHDELEATAEKHGGLIFGLDALQPEGHGSLLYVLYETLSGTPVGAVQMEAATTEKLCEWLQEYQSYPVLATISDGEDTIIAALKKTWPEAPHQRCQEHFLANLTETMMDYDTQLRQAMRENLGGLPKVPQEAKASPFSQPSQMDREIQN